MMNGGAPPDEPTYIRPRGLIVRGSSSETAVGDPLIARAARYITRNASTSITVDDVAATVPLSLRELQRRFRKHTGKTIHAAIVAARVKIARGLLHDADYKVDVVAEMSGFKTRQHFARVFKASAGISPIEYRRKFSR
jgi:transcriptional regulator GlxA family with amidase domain